MAVSKQEILDAIASMSVLDLSDLIKQMEEKFGVSAAAAAVAGDDADTRPRPRRRCGKGGTLRVRIPAQPFSHLCGQVGRHQTQRSPGREQRGQ